MKKILSYGSLNIDIVYSVPHFVAPGETIAARSVKRYPGGKGLNQSVALARAGAQVYHGGKLAADGMWLLALLRGSGADTGLVSQNGSDRYGGHSGDAAGRKRHHHRPRREL